MSNFKEYQMTGDIFTREEVKQIKSLESKADEISSENDQAFRAITSQIIDDNFPESARKKQGINNRERLNADEIVYKEALQILGVDDKGEVSPEDERSYQEACDILGIDPESEKKEITSDHAYDQALEIIGK